MSVRASAQKVASWFLDKGKPEEAVAILAAWAAQGANDQEGQALLAEALRVDPSARVAQQAFERMEGVASQDQSDLDAAIVKYNEEDIKRLERDISRPRLRAQVGFNNNVKYKALLFHIQTEDSGLDKPHIITHLFADGGRIIKSHKRSYAEEVPRPDVGPYVRALMKAQHMEMAVLLREGKFDEVIEGKKLGGMELLTEAPRTEVKKLATSKEAREEAKPDQRAASLVPPANGTAGAPAIPAFPPAGAGPADAGAAAVSTGTGRAHYRLHVLRSLSGGPAYYEPRGDVAIVGREGAIAITDKFCHKNEAEIRYDNGRIWLKDLESGNGVFLRIKHPVELEIGAEFIVGDQLLSVDRNPPPDDGPDRHPTYFYSSPKWPSSFRVVQVFQGGTNGACVVARGTTMLFGSAIGDMVFADDPLVSEQHCLVEEQAGVVVLTDLESRTGVFVRIKGEQELSQGDELLVGRTRLALEVM